MAEYCKVCGVGLKASNTVDYRPGSCRDCELERKKLYSSLSVDSGSSKSSKKAKKPIKKKKIKVSKSKTKVKKSAKKINSEKEKLKKQKLMKLKKLAKMKKLIKIRAIREQKRKKLRAKIEKLRKLRGEKTLKLKVQKKKKKEKERKEKEQLKVRIKKAKEIERRLLQKERERLKREKEKLRQIARQEKDKIRAEKRSDKDTVRAEKQRIKQEKQAEKEKLKKAKEAAKQAIVQAKEAARQAANEQRKHKEDSRKQPIVSIVTKLKEMQLPPDVKMVEANKDQLQKSPQPTKVIDLKNTASAPSASILGSAKVIPANAKFEEEKDILKQSLSAQHNETIQKEVEKLQKDADPIIDRYNPYSSQASNPNAPRPPSPTPWLAPNFTVVKGDFKETKQNNEDGSSNIGGLSDDQVKDIIEKIKGEHKRKST
jgi:DNA repair exonuclease SbcCD ATPase subunit